MPPGGVAAKQPAHDLPNMSNLVQFDPEMWTPIADTQTDIRLDAGHLD